jgi:CoA:oxalate CoA-transferase
MTTAMLEGYRVLDLSQYIAGAGCTRMLAEFGPEIIKVELAPHGDPSRLLPWVVDGRSSLYVHQNRGKRSLCVDWNTEEGLALIKELVPLCDVVVENFGFDVLAKRGLDYESVRELNPSVVMVSVSAFGRTSPYSDRPGFDGVIQAYSGMMHMTGDPERPPSAVGFAIVDNTAAVHAFAGLGFALLHRERTGEGQHIDIAMIDSMFHLNETINQAIASDGEYEPMRMGRHHQLVCPTGIFEFPEGYGILMALDRQFSYLATAMGRTDLLEDDRYATGAARATNQETLIPIIQEWLLSFPDNETLLAVCLDHRIPIGPALSPLDAIGHPHFEARDMVRTVPDPILGEVTIAGFPFKMSAQPELPDITAPLLGEHNEEVLRELLGYEPDRIASLRDHGVLVHGDR